MNTPIQTRGGSALVIVLGFLAILLLLVFAFAVKMQTEYRISRSAESNVRTEFVMIQGVHLTALEAGHPTLSPARTYWFYPRREIINGAGVLVGDEPSSYVDNFLAWPADLFIPQAVYGPAMLECMTNRIGILPSNFYGPIRDYYSVCGEPFRYVATGFEPSGLAYCILNASGYLDIHAPYQSGGVDRKYGKDVREIQLTDVIAATAAGLQTGRNLHSRIESMMELYAYRGSFGLTSDRDLSLFSPYSHAVLGQCWDTNSESLVNAVAITGSVASVQANAEEIANAFERAGFANPITIGSLSVPATEVRGWLLTNLLEYIDGPAEGDAPRRLDAPSQEALPGINELAVRSVFQCSRSGANYTYNLAVRFELEIWRPHVGPLPPQPCFVVLDESQVLVAPVSGVPMPVFGNEYTEMAATASDRTPTAMTPPLDLSRSFTTNGFTDTIVYKLRIPLGMTLKLGAPDGTDIDYLRPPIEITITNTLAAPADGGPPTENPVAQQRVSCEVIDPRFNWDFTIGSYWAMGTNSLGATNNATLAYLTNTFNNTDYQAGDDIDRATYAFCADRLPLDTVGELGYLIVAPWRTVRLVQGATAGRSIEKVVDTFTITPPGTRARGLINPNTCFTGVLQTVFNNSPVDLYPGDPAVVDLPSTNNRISTVQALQIATNILSYTYATNSSAAAAESVLGLRNGLLNLSDVGSITTVFQNTNLLHSMGIDCEFLRESLIRNTIGLMSTRNVSYTAVLCVSDEIDGGGSIDFDVRDVSRVAAEHKAVAMVWRDPWTKETFIRHFRYLPNDGILSQY